MSNNESNFNQMLFLYNNIKYYEQIMISSSEPCLRMFYESLLNKEINCLNQVCYQLTSDISSAENGANLNNQREFTLEELSYYDGSGGRPAYVSINNIVYDVSLEKTWGGGTHFSMYAGKDLTAQFNGCHGGITEVLRKLPQVGLLKQ